MKKYSIEQFKHRDMGGLGHIYYCKSQNSGQYDRYIAEGRDFILNNAGNPPKKINYFLTSPSFVVTKIAYLKSDLGFRDTIDEIIAQAPFLENHPTNNNYLIIKAAGPIDYLTYGHNVNSTNWELHYITGAIVSIQDMISAAHDEIIEKRNTKKEMPNQLKKKTAETTKVEKSTKRKQFFIDLQKQIEDSYPRAIRFESLMKTGRKDKTVNEFLIRFFKEFNNEKQTIHADDKSLNTGTNRRRSIGDIFMLTKYYYPNVTLEEVYKFLMYTGIEELSPGFRTSPCSQIRKRVWYYSPAQGDLIHVPSNNDEYGLSYNTIKSQL